MPKVTFKPPGQSFEVAKGTTILVSAIQMECSFDTTVRMRFVARIG
jgi:hypothetical protein